MNSIEAGQKMDRDFCSRFGIDYLQMTPAERLCSVLIFRNDRRLNRRICDWSKTSIVSAYSADAPFPVIKSDLWWGDGWDGLEYGIDPDPSLDFFQQVQILRLKVPREGTSVINAENCQFNSHVRNSRNCYLCHLAFECEDLIYCYWSVKNRDCIDCSYTTESTLCYSCTYVNRCYECAHLDECESCVDCLYSFQLRNCKNCLFCSNLSNAECYVRNEKCTPEQYRLFKEDLVNGGPAAYGAALEEFKQLRTAAPRRAVNALSSENVSGEHLLNSKNSFYCFDLLRGEDCYNQANGGGKNNIHGYSVGFPENENCYCSVTLRNCNQVFFSANCWNSNELWYCDNCVNCRDCFGCVGLKHKRYCFLNQQLTEETYRRTVGRWKEKLRRDGESGHYFPAAHSPFTYNESAAMDFFPLSRAEIEKRSYRYREIAEIVDESGGHSMESRPAVFHGGEIVNCLQCKKRYRILKKELEIYRQFGIAVPDICPDCRLEQRLQSRNPVLLVERTCNRCSAPVETVYSSDLAAELWCEDCFIQERA